MQWVKAIERLPKKEGMYYGKIKKHLKEIIVFQSGGFYREYDAAQVLLNMGVVQWLDETGEEIEKQKGDVETYLQSSSH